MSTAVAPRVRIALSLILALLLVAGVAALHSSATSTTALADERPAFLTWEGDPYDDGLSHFLIQTGTATESSPGLLERTGDGELSVTGPVPPDEVSITIDELDALIAGGATAMTDGIAETVARVQRVPGVEQVRAIGFGAVAVAGTIDAATLAAVPGVVRVDRDSGLIAATVDELYPTQWALENDGSSPETWPLQDDADIDAPEGWHRTRGAGVVVAVIDSGVDITHPDLAANIWSNPGEICGNGIDDDANGYIDDCNGWDFAAHDATVDDLNGHGTHVAGIIAAQANNGIGIAGVAYESTVMVLKVGDQTPALSSAIEAFAYAIDNGARIINASWIVEDPAAAAYLDPALDAARAVGVLVVTGAGNDGNDIDSHPVYPASAPHENVIVVGASTPLDQPAGYSGFGDTSVDLFAPGEHIVSTLPGGGYGAFSGTSMAAPMVAGAAALLWAATPEADYAEVKGALLDRSDGPNDGVTGFRDLAASDGRLNIERAIYTRLFQPSLMFTFHDFNSFSPDDLHTVTVQAQTIDPWIAHPQVPAQYRAGLYVPQNGQPMAVVGHTIVHTQNGAVESAVTDGTGRTLVGDVWEREERSPLVQDGDFTSLDMTLPAGTYAFVMEVVDVTDPTAPIRMGDPSAVFFIVNVDGTITEMPGAPLDGLPGTQPSDDDAAVTTTTAGDGNDAATTTTATPPNDTTAPDETTTTTTPTDDHDGATTTTTAPTDDQDGAATTTTAPTTTTLAADGNDATSTTTVAPDGMRITDVDPETGPPTGGTLVTITGVDLPADPTVWFGERTAAVVTVAAPTFIVVESPAGEPGYVDVRVVDRDSGDEAVYERGFRYVSEDDSDGASTPTTTVVVTTTVGTGDVPTTTAADADPADPVAPGGGLDAWLDGVLVTPEGLTLATVAPDDPIGQLPVSSWAGVLCDQPVCPGWVLED